LRRQEGTSHQQRQECNTSCFHIYLYTFII
jgi:hypothetical protein